MMEIKGDLLDGQLIETHEMFAIYQRNKQCLSERERIIYKVLKGLCKLITYVLIIYCFVNVISIFISFNAINFKCYREVLEKCNKT